jgi:hypothetical protein
MALSPCRRLSLGSVITADLVLPGGEATDSRSARSDSGHRGAGKGQSGETESSELEKQTVGAQA